MQVKSDNLGEVSPPLARAVLRILDLNAPNIRVKTCKRCGQGFRFRIQGKFTPKYCKACLKKG